MRKKTVITLFLLLLIIKATNANEIVPKMNLKGCIELALNKNHTLKQAKYDESIAEYETKEIKSAILPQINATTSLVKNISIPVVILPGELVGQEGQTVPVEFGSPYDAGVAIELSQIVFNQTFFIGIKTAKSVEELRRLKTQLTEEELIHKVGIVFYDILNSEQELLSIISNLKMQDSLYYNTALKVQQDLIREIDLNRIKVNKTTLKVRQEQLNSIIDQQKNYLKILIGYPLEHSLVLDNSNLDEIVSPTSLINNNSSVLSKVELNLLHKQGDIIKLNERSIKSQYLPTIALFASGGYQFQSNKLRLSNSESWFDHSLVGVRLSIPIFDGFRKQRQIKQVKFHKMKLYEEIEITKKTLIVDHDNAKQQLFVGFESINAQKGNFQLAEKIYEQSRLLYGEGLYNITDLLQTELALREAQIAYWSEVIRYKKAQLNLMKAEGTLKTLIK